ncbi:MAG TPA: enoyl-CoA hydratase/isomerase family protein [Rhodobacteraceae bacterium]|nr:enoyl-CoA hydratase/isomerase family protein [Paracoccaceae bacterium]
MINATLEGHIGRITLNRPEAHNALTKAAMGEIQAALEGWANSDIRAVIITGVGRSFCAGASLDELGDGDWDTNPLTPLCAAVEGFKAPVIAALNGGVFGGGVDLALACDFRIGVQGIKMFVPPAKLGIHYEPEGIARAVQRLGAQMARRVFLLAEKFEGEALLAHGFLDDLVAPDTLESRTNELAEILANLAPMAVQGMKQTILETSQNRLDIDAAKARVRACFASNDHAEGLSAMREKRPPNFIGS